MARKISQRVTERYGRASLPRPPGRLIWVHAASVGETNAVLPLIERLTAVGFAVLLTTTTLTSATVAAARLPSGAVHQFAPFDLAPYVTRFLGYWRPDFAIFVELELWPTMVRKLSGRGIPLVLVNARLSERSFRGWRRFAGFAGTVFTGITLCLAQSPGDAERFGKLGATNVRFAGNLKFDVPPLAADKGAVQRLKAAIGDRPVWVAAQTHEGEEEIVAEAHRRIRERHADALTIIVPRHPERGDAIRALLAGGGLTVAQRSRGNPLLREIDVYLADTLGELGLFYRARPDCVPRRLADPPGRAQSDRADAASTPRSCTVRTSTISPTSSPCSTVPCRKPPWPMALRWPRRSASSSTIPPRSRRAPPPPSPHWRRCPALSKPP